MSDVKDTDDELPLPPPTPQPLSTGQQPINVENYVGPHIDNASNPSMFFGWHHGPYSNPNFGLDGPTNMTRLGKGEGRKAVSVADNTPTSQEVDGQTVLTPPNDPIPISKYNSGVCGFRTSNSEANNEMCGWHSSDQPSLRKHWRTEHTYGTLNPSRANCTPNESRAGRWALIKYVRDLHWQQAAFFDEPGLKTGVRVALRGALRAHPAASEHATFADCHVRHTVLFFAAFQCRARASQWRPELPRSRSPSKSPPGSLSRAVAACCSATTCRNSIQCSLDCVQLD